MKKTLVLNTFVAAAAFIHAPVAIAQTSDGAGAAGDDATSAGGQASGEANVGVDANAGANANTNDNDANDNDGIASNAREPEPEVPGMPPDFDAQVVQQAGTGSDIAFASAGVVEVGGHGAVELAPDFKNVSLRPQAGWFVADNFELSAIAEFAWSQVEMEDGTEDSNTLFGLYAEPSYHLPFNNRTLGFIGIGVGPTYDSREFGFSLRPRLGLDVLIGRSGIFRPAFEVTYSTVDVVSRNNRNLVGVSTTYGLSLGFSTML